MCVKLFVYSIQQTVIKKISILFILFCVIGLFSCKKKTNQQPDDPIADISMNFNIDPNLPLNANLKYAGGWMYVNDQGVDGIIIYRITDINASSDFVAFERASTYYPNNPKAKAIVQLDNFTVKDTVSGSAWKIIDGAVLNGPATLGLRKYTAYYNSSTGLLNIRN